MPLKKSFQSKYSEVLETRQDTSVNRIDLDAIEKEISIDIAELRRDLRHSSYIYKESKLLAKVPILKECHFRIMKLCRVEHFHNIFVFTFGRDCYCIQPDRVSFFRSDILSKLVL